jgi:hypothetical protein
MKYMKVVTLIDSVSMQHAKHDMRQKLLAAAAAEGYLHYPRGLHELCEENLFTNNALCLATEKYHAQPRIILIAKRPPARAYLCSAGHEIFHILQVLTLPFAATSVVPQDRKSLRHDVGAPSTIDNAFRLLLEPIQQVCFFRALKTINRVTHCAAVWRAASDLARLSRLLLELQQLLVTAMPVLTSLAIKPLPPDIVQHAFHRMCDFVTLDRELVLTNAARGRAVVHGC